MNNDFIIQLIAITILIFLVTRMFWLWYFKIQERTDLLRQQNDILTAIFKHLGGSIEEPEQKQY